MAPIAAFSPRKCSPELMWFLRLKDRESTNSSQTCTTGLYLGDVGIYLTIGECGVFSVIKKRR